MTYLPLYADVAFCHVIYQQIKWIKEWWHVTKWHVTICITNPLRKKKKTNRINCINVKTIKMILSHQCCYKLVIERSTYYYLIWTSVKLRLPRLCFSLCSFPRHHKFYTFSSFSFHFLLNFIYRLSIWPGITKYNYHPFFVLELAGMLLMHLLMRIYLLQEVNSMTWEL